MKRDGALDVIGGIDVIDAPATATGLYVALLTCAIGTTAGIDRTVVLIGCALCWVAVALAVGRRPTLWVALARRRLLPVPLVAPLLLAVVVSVGLEYGRWSDLSTAALSLARWLLALAVVGIVITVTGTTSYAAQASGDRLVSWTTTEDSTARRRKTIGVALGVLVTLALFVAVVSYGLPSFFPAGPAAYTVSLWMSAGRARTFEACEHGLRHAEDGAGGTQFVPWSRFDGVVETEDAVVLERRWWFDERMASEGVPAAARDVLADAVGRS